MFFRGTVIKHLKLFPAQLTRITARLLIHLFPSSSEKNINRETKSAQQNLLLQLENIISRFTWSQISCHWLRYGTHFLIRSLVWRIEGSACCPLKSLIQLQTEQNMLIKPAARMKKKRWFSSPGYRWTSNTPSSTVSKSSSVITDGNKSKEETGQMKNTQYFRILLSVEFLFYSG